MNAKKPETPRATEQEPLQDHGGTEASSESKGRANDISLTPGRQQQQEAERKTVKVAVVTLIEGVAKTLYVREKATSK